MENIYVRLGFLAISFICIIWGGRIVFSNNYFLYWQNKYWKEKGGQERSNFSMKTNRFGKGLGALLFGIASACFILFQMN